MSDKMKKLEELNISKKELEQSKVSAEDFISQLETFEKGTPPLKIKSACTIDDGIIHLKEDEFDELLNLFEEECAEGKFIKFVPASGAASRMFRKLLKVYNDEENLSKETIEEKANKGIEEYVHVKKFFDNLSEFAFYLELKDKMAEKGLVLENLYSKGKYGEILKFLLEPVGLNFTNLPKALIKFHFYENHSRTPFEEHLVEAVNYVMDKNKTARIHFTVSKEHEDNFKEFFNEIRDKYEAEDIKIDISFSSQKESTDIVAVDMQNNPLRHENGELVFRPGGHGALLENLNELDHEYIFVKNVDNVAPDKLKEMTFKYKKLLGGYLIKLQNQIFDYLNKIDNGNLGGKEIGEIKNFAENNLWITFPDNFNEISHSKKNAILKNKLNRPLRVCGVVENQNEPGGGPFMSINSRGEVSPQIIEKNQIDLDDTEQKKIMESATHFNPVDLVCGIYSYKGEKFNLMEYRDPETALISTKFKEGEKLKALELPGLWNGSMADWITVFVDVPLVTFNPVKEVNDLLRENHLP